ncbi:MULTISPECIES: SF1B family DNA helicase RecD2 [Streptomyces]|jgi:exodeoxyribonuclease V alpha subunit|uniref:ATP-dependent RecD2 DNA helicase n=3 Tax=Streptomyces griseoaurantiacus TaxID=68213 RepID=F3NI97_9ACTN|nr:MULTISPECIES: ATP-dependent RecD-like DNA helicase [Streptomyces]EGG46733.1 deoxyribonuclease [Streptomyces griseoaurantiacus M045]MBA5222900.1 ATP-dependent RecD-like DNA helicase [Streptomyces griseoaurantiacus]MCF0085373.1 ATP-dependent RecD-like DNA helicase [Streptomyces sp. MH192]MCF0101952.1 ATP-dependent RecD-like DNA helicase [Streptomyces sp. MH191]MDX3088056.1 ATP-dependent RecD-like DNA helicase [Streptomyces sp. ME12-02E]
MSSQPPAAPGERRLAVLEGVLERITYANEENGYTVARVDTGRGAGDLLTVVGALLGAQVGESLRMEGRWGSHPQYGKQFLVENYTTVLPATVQGIRRYLGSGLVKGIGPVFADRITQHFGIDTLTIIEEEPKRLIEVPGLGPKRTKKIADAWEEQKAIKEVMLFLQTVEVSTSIAVRIYKKYGDASISVVKNQPYRLAADVWGIGFLTADKIAQSVGIPHDSPERVKAGLQYALSQATDQGHCYLPEERLIADAVKLLQVDTGLVIECLGELAAEPEDPDGDPGVVREKVPGPDGQDATAVYLVPFHRAELSLAGQTLRLMRAEEDRMPGFADVAWDKALGWLRARTGVELAPEQEAAVKLALTRKVAVLTGGPGCGKSFTVRSIVELARAKKAKVVLAAPTGRAAKRLAELTGAEASTVHRLLELKPGGDAAYDRERPLDADLVVVDEASMLDLLLANKLVKAVPPGAHLLFVGDVDQLPSVGAGEVLRDLLAEGGPVPAVRLTRVFRQAQQSGVVTNAHRINAGQHPVTDGMKDFFLFVEDDTEEAGRLTVDVAARRIPAKFGLDPRRDVQVLAPMHRGPAGAGTLNGLLQQAVTPGRPDVPEKRFGGRVFRVGDKVTQIRNNYDKGENGVFNGTVGVVTSLDPVEQRLTVLTDEDEEVPYDFDELDELAHAYAVTIHRSQGSEYPAVVIPVTTGAWMMLQRNLLYTAVTRAKRLVVLVGSRKAIGQAVRTVSAGRRCTALDFRLAGSRLPGGTG